MLLQIACLLTTVVIAITATKHFLFLRTYRYYIDIMLSQLRNTCQILYQSLPLRKSCTDAAISPTTFSRIVRTTTTRATREFQQQRSSSKNRQYHHSSCNTGKVSWSSTRMTLMSRSFQINYVTSTTTIRTAALTTTSTMHDRTPILEKMVGISLQASAGCLKNQPSITSIQSTPHIHGGSSSIYEARYPAVAVVGHPKRVLVLCTGGTMTMVPDTKNQNALTPQQGALSYYIQHHMVPELYYQYEGNHAMPEIVLHEYNPFLDSSDLGPDEFANVAQDIYTNYCAFDGFVVVTGTDTMAYFATSLSFMFEHLNKPIVFTGSQIPLCYPYNDARHNLIMAILFASRGGGGGGIDEQKNTGTSTNAAKATTVVPAIHEVTIFFHDRLLRANRSTKINTHQLMAFDSPNMKPLATIGISIQDNVELFLPQNNNNVPVQLHTQFDTRVLTLRLIPGFDDAMIRHMIERNISEQLLKGLVLQLYGTGNMPSLKKSFIDLLSYAKHQCGIVIVATTQCMTGSVQFGNYAVGTVMEQQAGVVSAYDMTMEATVCKLAYLLGRSETSTTTQQVDTLMSTSLRGEMTNQSMSSTRLK